MSARKTHITYEVALKVNSSDIGNIEILRGLLAGAGISEEKIVECKEWPYTFLSVYFNSLVKARALRKKLRAFKLVNVPVLLKSLHKKDWQTKWKKEFKPFALTENFGVVPMWLKHKHRIRGRMPIYIDTNIAFGTGLHATTRFMAQFVDRYRGRFTSFLDLGTGTGILAMIAAKSGANDVTAIDICRGAVEVAKLNCVENECPSINVKVADVRKYKTRKQYDFVCANIITQDLIEMAQKIISLVKPGKYLAVSGISINSYNTFRRAYAKYPLRCLKIEKGEGWVAILFKKLEVRARPMR